MKRKTSTGGLAFRHPLTKGLAVCGKGPARELRGLKPSSFCSRYVATEAATHNHPGFFRELPNQKPPSEARHAAS